MTSLHVLSVKSFAQYLHVHVRMQLKNYSFLHLFNIGWPCKHYNFQTCLHDNLVPRMLEMAVQSFQISKLFWGSMPPDPARLRGLTAPFSYSQLLLSNQLPTSNFIESPGFHFF